MKKLKALLPVLTKKESDPEFLESVFSQSDELVILAVIDTSMKDQAYGLGSSDIALATGIISEIIEKAKEKQSNAEDILEWGDTKHKILNTALLSKVKKVFFVQNDSAELKEMILDLNKNRIETELIEVIEKLPEEQEKEEKKSLFDFIPKINNGK